MTGEEYARYVRQYIADNAATLQGREFHMGICGNVVILVHEHKQAYQWVWLNAGHTSVSHENIKDHMDVLACQDWQRSTGKLMEHIKAHTGYDNDLSQAYEELRKEML